MQLQLFRDSPAGRLIPVSGHDAYLRRDYKHWAFVPNPLPDDVDLSMATHKTAHEASMSVGRLEFAVKRLPAPRLLVRPALRREAQSTSALEGTYATLDELLEADYVDEAHRRPELREVLNYVQAAEQALKLIKQKPICLNVIAPLQKILVKGTPGDSYDSGRLRETNVYIGERSLGIEAARFVPPPAGDELINGVSEWEKWIHREDDLPLLIKIAMAHYQFEALHPFSDGNGRLGRLIIALQLVAAGAMTYPVLNVSPWLEPRKDDYKDKLLAVSQTGDFDAWIAFFCEAIRHQAEEGVARVEELLEYQIEVRQQLAEIRARGVVNNIAESLLGYPVITISRAAELHNVTYPPASNAIDTLVSLGVLRENTGQQYGRVYVCDRIRDILNRT